MLLGILLALLLYYLWPTPSEGSAFKGGLKFSGCKPHAWRLFDQDGEIPEEADDERKRYGRLACIKCGGTPNSDTGPAQY